MLLVPFDLLCSGVLKRSAQAFSTPALRKVREGRGTRCLGDASEVKSLGHPPRLIVQPSVGTSPPFKRMLGVEPLGANDPNPKRPYLQRRTYRVRKMHWVRTDFHGIIVSRAGLS
jgi:hypothetical protein